MAEKTPKTRSKTTSAEKKAEPKKKTVASTASAKGPFHEEGHVHDMAPEERYRIIAETAYFIAERRGFMNGRSEDDWYEAERLIMNGQG